MIVIIQLFVLNNIVIGTNYAYLFQPQILIIFLLFIPVGISHIRLILTAFVAGLFYDMFFNSWGIHALVATFIGFTRHYVTSGIENVLSAREEDNKIWTSKKSQSWRWRYYLSFTFLYHFIYIIVDTLGKNFFTSILPAIVISTLTVFILILIIENLIFKASKN
jgi:hypothetical protein